MNHRSIPPRLGHPATSLSTEVVTSEPPRLRASALRLRRFRLPLAFALAVGFAGGYADGYRSHAFGGSYGFVLRPHLVGEFRSAHCVPPHAART
jgi:hypothetical protein